MGNGASTMERDRSVDASDIEDLDSAIHEIIRLRHMARESTFPGFEAEREKSIDAADMPSDLRICLAEVQRLRALIKVKIPTAERLRKQMQKESAQENLDMNVRLFQRKFQDAVDTLNDVNDTKIHQIRAINDPSKPLKLATEAVAALLFQSKKKKNKHLNKWNNSKMALAEPNFREKLIKFNLDGVKAKALKHISRICEDKALDDIEIAANSASATVMDTVAYTFMVWVRAVNAYCQSIYPKKEVLKQLTTEIKALRTPEEELGERFMNGRMQGLKTLHRFLDKDGNGEVSFKELQKFLTRYNCRELGKKKKQKAVREKVDIAFDQTKLLTTRGDVDGKYVCAADLDFTEFVSFMLTIFHVIFVKIDKNRNGTVEHHEIKELLVILYGPPEKKSKGEQAKQNQMFKKLKKCTKKGGALTQDVFTDFMIKILNTKASKKRNVLARLLSMAVSEKDWAKAKAAGAESTFIQTALAAEAMGQNFMRADHAIGPASVSAPRAPKTKKDAPKTDTAAPKTNKDGPPTDTAESPQTDTAAAVAST